MKLQKVLINILLCLCLEVVVSICGNEEPNHKGEQTSEASGNVSSLLGPSSDHILFIRLKYLNVTDYVRITY